MQTILRVLGIGSYYVVYFAVWLSVLLATAWLLLHGARAWPVRVRRIGWVVVAVFVIRLVLFDNPFALRVYQWAITPDNLGLRQGGVLELEIRKYRREWRQPPLANLAIGSSQVGAIFYQWSTPPPVPVGVYSLAGMKPLDFVLHEDAIAAYNPSRVILYLSAFDMTGSPELFSLPLAPSRPLEMWRVYARLRTAGLTLDEAAPSLHGYVASQLFPEYRYSFVYRALLRQWFGGAPRAAVASPARLPEFSSYFDPQWLDYNFLFLRDFLAFCQARGIAVLVAEGQINPAAMTPVIADLNATVRARLDTLGREFPVLRYVPASAVYEFSTAEYHDMTHVLPEAARRYTARFANFLR